VIILLVIGFGTYQLYQGNFEASMTTLPFLIVYYLFVTSWQKRVRERDRRDNSNDRADHG
ncbi:MAG: hypothetical protein PHO83_11345, partial [Geobacteraceae bacterium]|nr:hypothetical protein [Geobacteraceae bacterium]